jgi:hypothetical protein
MDMTKMIEFSDAELYELFEALMWHKDRSENPELYEMLFNRFIGIVGEDYIMELREQTLRKMN